jgi:hypothetical protein
MAQNVGVTVLLAGVLVGVLVALGGVLVLVAVGGVPVGVGPAGSTSRNTAEVGPQLWKPP